MTKGPVTEAEKAQVAELHREGLGRNAIARELGRSAGTVTRIAGEMDLTFDRSATKKATKARKDYAQEERLSLLNAAFEKARGMLDIIADPRELKDWTVAVGTLIDKRRLEDGEATDRSEHTHNRGLDLEAEFRKLDAELGVKGG